MEYLWEDISLYIGWGDLSHFMQVCHLFNNIVGRIRRNDHFGSLELPLDSYKKEDMLSFKHNIQGDNILGNAIISCIISTIFSDEYNSGFTKLLRDKGLSMEIIKQFKSEHVNAYLAMEISLELGKEWTSIPYLGDTLVDVVVDQPKNKLLQIRYKEALKTMDK